MWIDASPNLGSVGVGQGLPGTGFGPFPYLATSESRKQLHWAIQLRSAAALEVLAFAEELPEDVCGPADGEETLR